MPACGGGVPGANGYLIDTSCGRIRMPTCEPAFVPAVRRSASVSESGNASGSWAGICGSTTSPGSAVAVPGSSRTATASCTGCPATLPNQKGTTSDVAAFSPASSSSPAYVAASALSGASMFTGSPNAKSSSAR